MNPRDLIAAIKGRAQRWRDGDHRPDGRRIALVMEGGGMRGVCSAGGALALSQLGCSDVFDDVYATSAGVMNASYFLSGQPRLGIAIYYDDLVTRQFINPWRFWKIIDVDYMFDHVVSRRKRLDVDRVRSSRTAFYVAVIDKSTGRSMLIDARRTHAPLLEVLKAATSIPILYNRSVMIERRPCMDGGLAIPFPIEHALANGCTDVLVLSTRPSSFELPRPGWMSRGLFAILCARGNSTLRRLYADSSSHDRATRDLAFGRAPAGVNVNIATICPSEHGAVHRTSRDAGLLRDAATRYGRLTLRIFGSEPELLDLPALRSTHVPASA